MKFSRIWVRFRSTSGSRKITSSLDTHAEQYVVRSGGTPGKIAANVTELEFLSALCRLTDSVRTR